MSCQAGTGSWLVTTVERSSCRSLEDPQDVAQAVFVHRGDASVVDKQEFDLGQAGRGSAVAAIGPCSLKVLKEV